MVYPSGVTPSSSGSSSETSSSQSVAGTTAKSSSSAPPTSQNHTGRNLIFIGIALFVLSAAGIGTFLYLMFILPYLRKKRFLQNPQLAYAGAGAAAASTTRDLVSSSSQPSLQDAPEDVYYEDDYGNRYRREELPGYSDTELPQNHSYDAFSDSVSYPAYPETEDSYYLEDSASALFYASNEETTPPSYYDDANPYDPASQGDFYEGTGASPSDRDLYSGRDFYAPEEPYSEQPPQQYGTRESRRYDREWDQYFRDSQ